MNNSKGIFSEFGHLREVLVGRAYYPENFDYLEDQELKDMLQKILSETEEDLQDLVKIIKDFGASVLRPEIPLRLNAGNEAHIFDLQKVEFQYPNHPLMPRDTLFIYDDKISELFTGSGGRLLENWAYRKIAYDYFAEGYKLSSMPFPILENGLIYEDYNCQDIMLYHAANMIKCGSHIIHSQPTTKDLVWSGKGTEFGLEWMKREYPEAKFIESPCQGHIDGKMALLKPGLVATWDKKYLPNELLKWDCIEIDSPSPFPEHFQKMKKRRLYKTFVKEWLSEWIGYVDETVFDVNMFSLSEECVITNGYNKHVYDQFKKNKIEAIPWNFRHQYFWDGAIHCVTLDLKRDGGPENYLC